MSVAVEVRRGGSPDALAAAGALALSAVMTLLVPLLGAVRTADRSPVWFAPGALWIALLPALVAAAVALWRPVAGLAVAAGAGLIGLVRLLADLPVVTVPDSLARPDLFVETTDRSLPFHAAGGGYLLLAADVVALAAGVFAASRLAGRLSLRPRADLDAGPREAAADGSSAHAGVGAEPAAGSRARGASARESDDQRDDQLDDQRDDQRDERGQDDGDDTAGSQRNYLLTAAGFLGVLLLAVGALAVPYQGGYLTDRFVSVGVPFAGIVAAVLLAVIAATAVLVGESLPRALAVALLGGVALGAAVSYLTAVVAAVTAPVQLSFTVWLGLAGAVLLAAAGFLTRARMVRAAEPAAEVAAPSRSTAVLAGVAGLLAAGLAAAAFVLPPLDAGGLEKLLALSDGSPVPGSTLFVAAAIPLAIAGVLALVVPTARAGRAALLVLWAAPVPAVTAALQVLGDDGISTARLLHVVTIGAGTWCGVAALALAGVAAVLAAVTSHRAGQAWSAVPDDESVAAVRARTVPLVVVLGVLTVVAALLPVYTTAGQVQGPTVLRGYTVDAWGVWAQVLATLGALVGAAATRRRSVALAAILAAAALQAARLVVPAGVAALPGFELRAGLVVQVVLVAALVAGAVVVATLAGRIREWDAAVFDAAFRAPDGAGGASSQAGTPTGTRARPAQGPARRRGAGGPATRPVQRSRRKHR